MLRTLFVAALLAIAPATEVLAQNAPTAAGAATSKKEVPPPGMFYGIEKARPKKSGALRLACYNVENLFDQKDDPANPFDQDEMTKPERLEALAKTIRELDADILCLEEVESKECLLWFRDTYLKGMGYEHAASEDNGYNRGIEQSVLSRVPIVKAQVYTGEDLVISDMESRRNGDSAKRLGGTWAPPAKGSMPERFQRSPMRVDLKTKDGYPLTVYVVHFKAGRDFDHQRELEALQVEAWVEEELKSNPDANIAVLGDYNGTPNDMNVKALRMSDDGLVSAYDWRFDPKAKSSTYATHASERSIDFIVMSPGLAADCVDGSYFVLGTMQLHKDADWRTAEKPQGYASDHMPVSIELVPKDKPASAFKRAQPKESAAATSGSNAGSSGTEPATKAQSGALRAVDGGKQAPAADVAAATKLVAAGWRYVMPEPKSKAAKWGNKDTRTTWWPGYWKNASGATSVAQPAEADKFAGDGAAKPGWKDGGSPKTPTWVEWLCSESGGVMPE
ncbi:MAG: endonuclease/exonuclease/phosphatase family protein [Planctomycetaceae bacterium]|nr:endonuclease/exonuclease/phosphatase family protein [Planctomycetaceae bacterium]